MRKLGVGNLDEGGTATLNPEGEQNWLLDPWPPSLLMEIPPPPRRNDTWEIHAHEYADAGPVAAGAEEEADLHPPGNEARTLPKIK